MHSYYDIETRIVPGWTLPIPKSLAVEEGVVVGVSGIDAPNPSRWPTYPHVAMANLGFPNRATIEQVRRFTGDFGPVVVETVPEKLDHFQVLPLVFGLTQDMLRRAWSKPTTENVKALWVGLGGTELDVSYLPVTWAKGAPALRPADVWTFMRLLAQRDMAQKRARICANETCPAPFFVAGRSNQKYCSWDCTNVVQQRNFRKRWKGRKS